ncbi:MAG: 2-amino-4-hydroxy-6-hydroxymethyldihydropteridine diphosphokinase [Thiotrichaceae bacterium]
MISYIGLGSNLNSNVGNSTNTLHSAFSALDNHSDITLITHSSFYGSKPHGPQDQPDYVNAVAKIETSLEPLDLLDTLQHIENTHNRIRTEQHWGPRTLDLDLLLYDNQVIESERLIIPHPRITERSFVLYPLDEITNGLIFPNGEPLADYLTTVDNDLWILQTREDIKLGKTSHDKA